jgi:hypothetical protein
MNGKTGYRAQDTADAQKHITQFSGRNAEKVMGATKK